MHAASAEGQKSEGHNTCNKKPKTGGLPGGWELQKGWCSRMISDILWALEGISKNTRVKDKDEKMGELDRGKGSH